MSELPLPITPDMLLSRRRDFERHLSRRPPLTLALMGALALVFAGEVARGALDSTAAIVEAGALLRRAVVEGEAWRLVSATFLHGGVGHLAGNLIALYILGMLCEHAFGARQLAVLYVLSGLAGSALSLITTPGPSVGASGAIFGLQGAAIVLFRRHRDRLLVRDRRLGVVLLAWAAFTILGGLASPFIDNGAHAGGFLGGALIGWWLHPVVLEPMSPDRTRRVRRWLVLVIALLVYGALGWALSAPRLPIRV